MIQRIQTLFLMIAFGLIVSLFYNKLCYAPQTEPIMYTQFTPFLILTIISAVICFFTIFIFKHRILQIRLCIFNILVLLGYQAWIAYAFFTREPGVAFSVSAVFPIVCAILTFIAMRYIARDEAMVRAANSIRSSRRNRKK